MSVCRVPAAVRNDGPTGGPTGERRRGIMAQNWSRRRWGGGRGSARGGPAGWRGPQQPALCRDRTIHTQPRCRLPPPRRRRWPRANASRFRCLPQTRLARATVCTPPAWGFPQGVAGGARAPAFEGRLEDEQTRGRKARAAECNRKETHGTGGRWAWPSPPHPPSPGAKPDHERARARPAHPALPPGAAVAAERAGLPRRVHSLSCSRVCREERRVCLVDAPPRQVPPPRHPQLPHARHAAAAGDGRQETKRTPRFTLPLA